MKKSLLFAVVAASVSAMATAQTGNNQVLGDVTSDSQSEANVNTDAAGFANSGGNIFDFSDDERNTPSAPALSNFGTGPCIGSGYSGAGSGPGFSLGIGYQSVDESCTRRAWAQALIAAAERMPSHSGTLQDIAFELMLNEPIVREAVQSLRGGQGISQAVMVRGTAPVAAAPGGGAPAAAPSPRGNPVAARPTCVIAVSNNAPAMVEAVLQERGCQTARMQAPAQPATTAITQLPATPVAQPQPTQQVAAPAPPVPQTAPPAAVTEVASVPRPVTQAQPVAPAPTPAAVSSGCAIAVPADAPAITEELLRERGCEVIRMAALAPAAPTPPAPQTAVEPVASSAPAARPIDNYGSNTAVIEPAARPIDTYQNSPPQVTQSSTATSRSGCTVVLGADAPAVVAQALAGRGCEASRL